MRSLTPKTCGPACKRIPAANVSPVSSRSQARWRASEVVTVPAALISIPISCPPAVSMSRSDGIPVKPKDGRDERRVDQVALGCPGEPLDPVGEPGG